MIYTQKNLLYDTVLSVSDVMNLLSTVFAGYRTDIYGVCRAVAPEFYYNFHRVEKKKEIGILSANRCPRRRCVLDFLLRNGCNRWHLPNIIGDRYADCGNGY